MLGLRLRPETDVTFQAHHIQHQQDLSSSKMNTQRLDLPRNFPRKSGSHLLLSLEKPTTGSCSFKPQNPKPSSSSSLIAHTSKKRFHDLGEDLRERITKRKKLGPATSERETTPEAVSSDSSNYPPSKELSSQGTELVNLLTACVDSVRSTNHEATTFFLSRLGELSSPSGSVIHRVAAYFTEALSLRAVTLWPDLFSIAPRRELSEKSTSTALRALNCVTPVIKFLHFSINEKLLEHFETSERIHVIDFDVKDGIQWGSFLQSLASRVSPPTQVRITGVGEIKQELQEVGARLSALAETLNLQFEFHPVVDRLEDVRLWMLHVREKESLAVNCVFQLQKLLYCEGRDALGDFLSLLRSTKPEIILMAEREVETNSPRWASRFVSSLQYYSALFDMMDHSLPLESLARVKVEEMFAKELRDIICGDERCEVFSKWRRMMEERGFRCAGIGEREELLSRMLIRMYRCKKYGVEVQVGEDDDVEAAGLTLRWKDQPLYTVSAWRCD